MNVAQAGACGLGPRRAASSAAGGLFIVAGLVWAVTCRRPAGEPGAQPGVLRHEYRRADDRPVPDHVPDHALLRSREGAGAGAVGEKFIYDLWGDTGNTASRMESYGLPGRIHVSDVIRAPPADRYAFEPRPPIKGKGLMTTFFLVGRFPRPAPVEATAGS